MSLVITFFLSAIVYALILAGIGLAVSRFTVRDRSGIFTTFFVTGLIVFYISLYATIKISRSRGY